MLTPAGNPPSSQANELADLLDPTSRDLADMEYAMQLGDPLNHEPLIGCPLSIGGLVSSSVKVRCTQLVTFAANAAGDAYFVAYQHVADLGDVTEFAGVPTGAGGARVPTVIGGTDVDTCMLAAMSRSDSILSTTPTSEDAPGATAYDGVFCPQLGVNLFDSDARMIAQSFKIQPTSSALTTQGTGFIVRVPDVTYQNSGPGNANTSSLSLEDPESVWALQNAEKTTAALPNWDPDHFFTTNMLPKQVASVTFTECYPQEPYTPPYERRALPGAGYAGFWAFGCAPGQTFVCELTTIFEIKGSYFAYATPNPPQIATMNVLSNITAATAPQLATSIDLTAKGLVAAASHAHAEKGPSLGKRFVDKFIKWLPSAKAAMGRLSGGIKGFLSSGGKLAAKTIPLMLAAAPAMMKANRASAGRFMVQRPSLGWRKPLPPHVNTAPSRSPISSPARKKIRVLADYETPLRIGSSEGKKDYHFLYENFKGSRADRNGDFRVHDMPCSLCSSGNWVLMVDKLEAVFDAASETVKTPIHDGASDHRASPELEYQLRDYEISRSGRREHMVHWPSTVGDSGKLTTFQCETDCKMCLSGLVRVSGDELTFWCFDHEGIISMNLKARSAHLECLKQLADATRLAEFADAAEKSVN